MALITSVTPVFGGVATAGAAVAASDTIAASTISPNGCLLIVTNGGVGSINVTISDPGFSPLSNAGTAAAVAVTNGTSKVFRIPPAAINTSTGVATVTYSDATSVTYQLFKL